MATRSTRPLVESALLAALSAVLVLLAWYVPIVGLVASLASPLPVAVVVIRHGARWGVMSSVVSMFVIAPFLGIPTAVAFWAINGAMGISFGVAVHRHFRPTMVLTTAALGSVVALIIDYTAAWLIMGLTLTKQIEQMLTLLRESFEQAQKVIGSNPTVDEFLKTLPTVDTALAMAPAVLLLSAFLLAFVNFEVFRRILPRLGHRLEALPPFSRWIFPEFLAHAGIVAFLLSVFQARIGIPALALVAQNVFSFVSVVSTVEALAVMVFYLLRSGMSRGLAGFFAFMAVSMMLQPGPLSLLAALFGMIDILFDFRHIRYPLLDEI